MKFSGYFTIIIVKFSGCFTITIGKFSGYTNCNSKFLIRNLEFYNGKCRYYSKTSRLNARLTGRAGSENMRHFDV